MKIEKLWGGRMVKASSPRAESFTAGRDVRGVPPADERLIPYDLWGSRAHTIMLARQGIISRPEARKLIAGLKALEASFAKGGFRLDPAREDVHSNVEAWLIARSGWEAGGRLHTARSRNDQISLDLRMYLRDRALEFGAELLSLLQALLDRARRERAMPFPGYSHHQPAQITTLGHIWISFAEALLRDLARFQDWYGRFNRNPLGSMTGFGTSFAVDRLLTTRLLAFDRPHENSLDPIQQRWEAEAEIGFAAAVVMNHLSSLSQTLILLSTGEFGLIRLDDAYCSGSSMMPQKRNPDPLEVVKGKAATVQGQAFGLLSLGRSLFLGYNRETQWSKYLVMDLLEESLPAPGLISEVVRSLKANERGMAAACAKGFIAAPDLLEWIIQRWKIPFRKAKAVMEKAVRYSEQEGSDRVSLAAWQKAWEGDDLGIDPGEFQAAQEPAFILSRRRSLGGPSGPALERSFESVSRQLKEARAWLRGKRRQQAAALARLSRMEESI
ncbi:MAG: argininosuccinate lyase [Deltaproteobacteria bacterium]|nr:argininosuccinate lyase [Deltaproteobacteria bacterium]